MRKANEVFAELMKEAEALALSLFRDWPQQHRADTVSQIRHRMNDMDWELRAIAQAPRRDRASIEALERQRSALVDGVLGAMRAEGLAPGMQQSPDDQP